MTTEDGPELPSPSEGPKAGDGDPFVIGGGDDKFGQDYTKNLVGQMFKIPSPTLGGSIALLREYLIKLPLEVLKSFKDLIPGTVDDDFIDVLTAVDTIIGGLEENLCVMIGNTPVFHGLAQLAEGIGGIFSLGDIGGGVGEGEYTPKPNSTFPAQIIRGTQALMDTLCAILTCGIISPGSSTPQTLINVLLEIIDVMVNNPITQGIISFAQAVGVAVESTILTIFHGVVHAVQTAFNILTCGALGADNPGGILDFFQEIITSLTDNPIIGGLKDLVEETENAVMDTIQGALHFLTTLGGLIGMDGDLHPGGILDFFTGLLRDLIGFFTGFLNVGSVDLSLKGLIDAFLDFLEKIPLIGPLIHALTGGDHEGDDLGGLADWFQKNILKTTSPLPAGNLFGSIPQHLLSLIPLSNISAAAQPNLVNDFSFSSASVIQQGGQWSWDGTKNATGSGGSAKVTCNGAAQSLYSNIIPVSPGQKMGLSAKVWRTSLVGTGVKVIVGVRTYYNSAVVTSATTVASSSTTGTSSAWETVGANWTVPAGVDAVRLIIGVTSAATSGTVNFDDLSVVKNGLLSGDWMNGVEGTILGDLQTTVDNIVQAVGGTAEGTGHPLVKVLQKVQSIFTTLFGINKLPTSLFSNPLVPAAIPGLDASKITSGTVPDSRIPGLDGSKIITGLLSSLRIPGLDGSKINSGQVGTSYLPMTTIINTVGANVSLNGSGGILNGYSTGSAGSGLNYFGSFYNYRSYGTSDIYASGGLFQVTYAGWYTVDLGFALNTGAFADWNISPVIVTSGGTRYGTDQVAKTIAGVGSGPRYISASWNVYLNAGGTVYAAYDASRSISNVFAGNGYFGIALANHSLS